jgi:hypothetical protein
MAQNLVRRADGSIAPVTEDDIKHYQTHAPNDPADQAGHLRDTASFRDQDLAGQGHPVPHNRHPYQSLWPRLP